MSTPFTPVTFTREVVDIQPPTTNQKPPSIVGATNQKPSSVVGALRCRISLRTISISVPAGCNFFLRFFLFFTYFKQHNQTLPNLDEASRPAAHLTCGADSRLRRQASSGLGRSLRERAVSIRGPVAKIGTF